MLPHSRPSVLRPASRQPEPPQQQLQHAQAQPDFRFEQTEVKPRQLSPAAARLMARGQRAFKLPDREPAIGDEMPGLAQLLGGGVIVRRVQPSPDQLEQRRGGGASAKAPPPPPRQSPPVSGPESEFVRAHRSVLQRVVAAGRGVPVTPPQPSRQELAKAAMRAAQQQRFGNEVRGVWAFRHITEQSALFRSIGAPSRTPACIQKAGMQSWYSSDRSKGLLVDIGAVRPLTGQAFVESQVRDMEAHGFKAIWSQMPKPEYMRGVGEGSQRATRRVNLVGALHDGGLLAYEAPVLDAEHCPESAGVPPLYGLDFLSRDNGLFDSRSGALYCLPVAFDASQLNWPQGTRILQCERSTGGHWLLGVDHWDKVDPSELRRVQSIRSSAGRPVV